MPTPSSLVAVTSAQRLPHGEVLIGNGGTHELRLLAPESVVRAGHRVTRRRAGRVPGPGSVGILSDGRLPVTFYRLADLLPSFTDDAMAGRTYRYFAGEPLFPCGHGLS